MAVLVALFLATGARLEAIAVASVPCLLAIMDRRYVAYRYLFAVLALTVVFGRDFTYLHVGILYSLEGSLIFFGVVAMPDLLGATRRVGFASLLAIGLISLSLIWLWRDGISADTLRQSVLGLYAAWAAVGAAIAFAGRAELFTRLMYWSSIGATIIFFLAAEAPTNPITAGRLSPIPVASCIYMGMGILFILFAPHMAPSGTMARLVLVAQIGLIGVGEVRSVWVALPAATVLTIFICGTSREVRRRISLYPGISAAFLAAAALVVAPSVLTQLSAEARSIYNYQGSSTSDANARWRIRNWRYAERMIKAHPLAGVGWQGEEEPPSVCTTGCSVLNQGDPTVGPGAALHNSILAIGLRLGIPGLVLFSWMTLLALVAARRASRGGDAELARWLCAVMLLVLFSAGTAVVLEGPYMGVFFWLACGMLLALARRQLLHRRLGSEHEATRRADPTMTTAERRL
jgi:O-antigen ligase